MKGQPTEWENIFDNDTPAKGYHFYQKLERIYAPQHLKTKSN